MLSAARLFTDPATASLPSSHVEGMTAEKKHTAPGTTSHKHCTMQSPVLQQGQAAPVVLAMALTTEPQGNLLVCVLHAVAAVDDVAANLNAVVTTDGAGLAGLQDDTAQHTACQHTGESAHTALPDGLTEMTTAAPAWIPHSMHSTHQHHGMQSALQQPVLCRHWMFSITSTNQPMIACAQPSCNILAAACSLTWGLVAPIILRPVRTAFLPSHTCTPAHSQQSPQVRHACCVCASAVSQHTFQQADCMGKISCCDVSKLHQQTTGQAVDA